jgi:hypothetical protein
VAEVDAGTVRAHLSGKPKTSDASAANVLPRFEPSDYAVARKADLLTI